MFSILGQPPSGLAAFLVTEAIRFADPTQSSTRANTRAGAPDSEWIFKGMA
jgi:hypothetical protein